MTEQVESAVAAYQQGEVSAEIAVMRLLLALGGAEAVIGFLQRLVGASPPPIPSPACGNGWQAAAALLRVARAHQDGLAGIGALVEAGLVREQSGSIAAIRAQFDRAVAVAPEAAVALYSLGSAEILERATAEIVERLGEWGLLAHDVEVLDIGCGIGRIERALAPHVGCITGSDISPAMIDEARRRCRGLDNVDFACGTGAHLSDFTGRRFGLVLAIDAFPYLVAAGPAIAARHIADAAGLLTPGGALVIFNYSYRGDLAADRADVARLAAAYGFLVERGGTRDFNLWDGATFLLR